MLQAPVASSPADACAADAAFEREHRAWLSSLLEDERTDEALPRPVPAFANMCASTVRKVFTASMCEPLFVQPSFVYQQPLKFTSCSGDSQVSTSQGSQCDDADVREVFVESSLAGEEEYAQVPMVAPAFVQPESSAKAPMDAELLGKTKFCKYFVKGACARGDACTYAHGKRELRPKPILYRTGLCLDFLNNGNCQYGEKCRYAHGAQSLLVPRTAIVASRHRTKKRGNGQPQGQVQDQEEAEVQQVWGQEARVQQEQHMSVNRILASLGLLEIM
eukprot:CAMPEP_0203952910 /NCGR_PEP_ID=MMETSP0359-20131031/86422_1 /ASSEMBLY_ACC=CAM_ASM_000338 /TAXON_ID=268821 /ORGANISM="Scrippsiella Hangoei, Strain SHTV-5" /LENGTH=275 /DNA_ID=CAMNT_0050886043 /DNA_START=129 /DNA_END=956 /DNA_ORIENTATION=-